ncbi:hypothetical protein X801_03047 [Opisthorchis viverrini]|uniref:Uncharacterized protein n=1 Tax=Opisthorchis viverrini TaxID=6198 RepID=A0A1S8X2X9_OPIVI|nr:hypothetical protein X801_03047 [Opisthorchis viverrini]
MCLVPLKKDRLKHQLNQLEATVLNQGAQISELKKENARLLRELNQREVELETQELKLEQTTAAKSTPRNTEFVRELQNFVNRNVPAIPNKDSAGESAVLVPGVKVTLELLQKRLLDKEESLKKAKELFRQVYETNVNVNQLRKREMEEIQTQLNHKISETIRQLSTTMENRATKPHKDSISPVLMQRLQQLELELEEQNEAIIRQNERSKSMHQESQLWKLQFQQLQEQAKQDRKTLEDSYKQKVRKLFLAYRQLRSDVEERDKKLDEMKTELEHWKQEAKKSPSMMQRQMNERLKADLTEKSKQLQVPSALKDCDAGYNK